MSKIAGIMATAQNMGRVGEAAPNVNAAFDLIKGIVKIVSYKTTGFARDMFATRTTARQADDDSRTDNHKGSTKAVSEDPQ
ncbi:MAG: Variable large protein [Candidatus Midichloria mitochondrii]|uniref:Uncharacterized protein n=1 Tax=Midichloria mitochondrii (strain IricVA) TaxID=696127 RepID=F7XWM3_MIDMI|nr:hypothetical protein [Candidatus Midichloria mitochondrii]AEI89072.1 hypothetical protein midi_00782 [Candidatus Midichloria mitochondrii IricVA]MDJ1256765.1 hypothetical protein [Candidatus Midichloria mitochondrii]MDJ1288474.1 hypothetical protein [Candidatus Midichloria mitochondrii]MDJ1299000.1 hypothetical protein [Candidatus Midichloria mitochondrii]MDJ1313163.1 hypothetical protein [Candidatus Midichloria mitochondrii]